MATHSDIEAGRRFDEAVRATGTVGGIRADVANIKADVGELKADVKVIRTKMDNWAGKSAVIGALVALASSVAVSVYGSQITKAIAAAIVKASGQ